MEAKKIAADLFTDIERVEPPDFIWHRVKEAIVSEQLSGPRHAAVFLEKLRSLIFMPKPAFILATALTLALIFGVTLKMMLNREYPLRGNSSEYSELLDNLTGPGTDISMASESDLGTSIETYFM